MKYRLMMLLGAIITMEFLLLFPAPLLENSSAADGEKLKLFQALMSEDIVSNTPKTPTMIFSASKEKAVCFSLFDPVPKKTVIYHNWYHRDVPSARIQLNLKPPRWATYSSIQLRKTDIGPWRVEISDDQGRILKVLRFSVTE
jgi:hypothetical protein